MNSRRRLHTLVVIAALAVVWEGGKALFAIPGYQLPHLHEIFADFLREGSKAVIAAYLTFFPVTINMARGLRAVEPDALALMRALAASSWHVFWKLRLPASLPYLFTALRIAATASVIGAIVGELPVGSRYGMGVVIINAAQYYNWRPANLWAAILVSALIGIAFYHVVAAVERRVVTWSQTAPAI